MESCCRYCLVWVFFLFLGYGVESSLANKVYRTAYHFQPPKNWINDPNGPMYYNGLYHFFYQYNPNAAVWGNIHWAHSVSVDLINWAPLDLALAPTAQFDINGVFSGSATILSGDTPVILYTGADSNDQQVQNIAFPSNLSDPFLRQWTKPDFNPLLVAVNDIDSADFRDPTTAWLAEDGRWRIAIGALIENRGTALLYRSADFVHWERADSPLHSSSIPSSMWECPDFFPVLLKGREGLDTSADSEEVKHVFKMSLYAENSDHYMLGKYDQAKDIFVPDDCRRWLTYDHGKFYASKSFFDSKKKRRILWAWVTECDSESDDVAKGWAGIQTVPRTIWLDSSEKQLLQWPVEEVESLRRNEIHLHDLELKPAALYEIKGVKASQADVEVDFELPSLERAQPFDPSRAVDAAKLCSQEDASVQSGIGPFGLLVLASENLEEHTAVYFRIYKDKHKFKVLMCSDQRRSSLRPEIDKQVYGVFLDMDLGKEGKISLRTLIDHSVIESFGGEGRGCITARVYPSFLLTASTHLYVFNNDLDYVMVSRLKAWHMVKAKLNLKPEELGVEN